jgi:hypothetical protein
MTARNCSVNCRDTEVWPLTLDFYIRLIHVLAVTDGATAFFAQGVRQIRGEIYVPVPHGFMREHDGALEKHFGELPQAQLVPEAPQDDQADDIRGIVQPIEGRPGPFVEIGVPVADEPKPSIREENLWKPLKRLLRTARAECRRRVFLKSAGMGSQSVLNDVNMWS